MLYTRRCRQYAVVHDSCTPRRSWHTRCCRYDRRQRRPACSRRSRAFCRHTTAVSSHPACTARRENTGTRHTDLRITDKTSVFQHQSDDKWSSRFPEWYTECCQAKYLPIWLTIFISPQKVLLAPSGPLRGESGLSLVFTVVLVTDVLLQLDHVSGTSPN